MVSNRWGEYVNNRCFRETIRDKDNGMEKYLKNLAIGSANLLFVVSDYQDNLF